MSAEQRFEPLPAPSSPQGACGLTYADLRRAIFLVLAIYLALRFISALAFLLLLFLLALVVAAILNPIVAWLHRRGIPRGLSALGVGAVALGLIAGGLWLLAPPIIRELGVLVRAFPQILTDLLARAEAILSRYTGGQVRIPPPADLAQRTFPYLSQLLGVLGATVRDLVGAISLFFVLLVVVIYSLARPEPLVTGLLEALPPRMRAPVEETFRVVMRELSGWATGTLLLGAIVAVMVGIALALIGMPFVFVFALIAGVGELIPILGPLLSAIPPTIVALAIAPRLALWVILIFWLVQTVENNLIVPLVMSGRLEFHPVSVTFVIIGLGTLYGLLGAILAVPAMIILRAVYRKFYLEPRREEAPSREEALRLIEG